MYCYIECILLKCKLINNIIGLSVCFVFALPELQLLLSTPAKNKKKLHLGPLFISCTFVLKLCAICITTLSWHNLHGLTTIHLIMNTNHKVHDVCSVVVTIHP